MRRWQTVMGVVTVLAAVQPLRGQERAAPAGPTHHIYITAVGKDGIPVQDSRRWTSKSVRMAQ